MLDRGLLSDWDHTVLHYREQPGLRLRVAKAIRSLLRQVRTRPARPEPCRRQVKNPLSIRTRDLMRHAEHIASD